MENSNNDLAIAYQKKNEKSYKFLSQAVEYLKLLTTQNIPAYIIGEAVRNFCLNLPLENITIIAEADNTKIRETFPALIIKKNCSYLRTSYGNIYFRYFDKDVKLSLKDNKKYYYKPLTAAIQEEHFKINALALSPNFVVIDIDDAQKDLNEGVIRPYAKAKSLFQKEPMAILEALLLIAKYDFYIENKVFKQLVRNAKELENIDQKVMLYYIKEIVKSKNAKDVIKLIVDNDIMRFLGVYELYFSKLKHFGDKMTYLEKISLLYLLLGKIVDFENMEQNDLAVITDNMEITQLLTSEKVTSMMVYHYGVDRLISGDNLAITYRKNYKSQAKIIRKLSRKLKVNSMRDLDFTSLELTNMLHCEKNIKTEAIMNILLEHVLNGKVKNEYNALKSDVNNLLVEWDEIFEYVEPKEPITYDDEKIASLETKYHKEFNFLVKIYLNDEKDMYSLSALERAETIQNAKDHAKNFLLETSQYKILVERGLI